MWEWVDTVIIMWLGTCTMHGCGSCSIKMAANRLWPWSRLIFIIIALPSGAALGPAFRNSWREVPSLATAAEGYWQSSPPPLKVKSKVQASVLQGISWALRFPAQAWLPSRFNTILVKQQALFKEYHFCFEGFCRVLLFRTSKFRSAKRDLLRGSYHLLKAWLRESIEKVVF